MDRSPKKFVIGARTRSDDARTIEERIDDLRLQIDRLMDTEHQKEVGARIKQARENSPFKQRDLAARAHVQLRTWQAWEVGRGINRPNVEVAAKALRVDAERLWRGAPEEPSIQSARIESQLEENAAALGRVEAKLDALLEAVRLLASGLSLPDELLEQLLLALLQAEVDAQVDTSSGNPGEVPAASGAPA